MKVAASLPAHSSGSNGSLEDVELVRRAERGDRSAFEALMRRYNASLFRVARSILKNESDCEDALQEAYLAAYRHLGQFKGEARLSTWLTRIVINQALGQLRARKRDSVVVSIDDHPSVHGSAEPDRENPSGESPEGCLMRGQMRQLLERKIDELPLVFRTVFVMRELQEMTVDQTSECLSIPPATVRTRFFRARSMLRESLAGEFDRATGDVFSFGGANCDRIVAGVLARLPTVPDAH
ncbi:MAG: RNA polymerase sigma factor [Burkholderiaceae bacterium]|nr:RNA polymerase sigma factor [Burkholderiaceae bacterium]